MRPSRVEEQLVRIAELRRSPPDAARDELGTLLGHRSQHVVAKAAQAAGMLQLVELTDALEKAFERFFADPTGNDPRCVAITEIVKALVALEAPAVSIYLRGIRHRQRDSLSGDTAVDVRSHSAIGLARMRYPYAVLELVELLRDEAAHCRASAARALAAAEPLSAEPLLRFKVITGDPEPAVLEECLSVLLEISPERSFDFVKRFLASDDLLLAESAAMALGASRNADSFAVLSNEWRRRRERQLRRSILLALAMVRRDETIEFLLSVAGREELGDAKDAISALRIYRDDEKISERVRKIVEARQDRTLDDVFRSAFQR